MALPLKLKNQASSYLIIPSGFFKRSLRRTPWDRSFRAVNKPPPLEVVVDLKTTELIAKAQARFSLAQAMPAKPWHWQIASSLKIRSYR